MELRHLRYFAAAAEDQNFTRAADRLNVTVPALSRRIRDLEEEIGAALFERRRQRVYLTEAGAAFLEDVHDILDRIGRSQIRARSIADRQATTLRIGIHAPCTRHKVIGTAINQFLGAAETGQFKLDVLLTSPLMTSLRAGDLDAAFIHRADMGDHIEAFDHIEVACDNYVLLLPVGHPLAERSRIFLRDLVDEKFIWLSSDLAPHMHDALLKACADGGLKPDILQRASSVARIQLTAAGAGVTFVLTPLWEPFPDTVVARRVEDLSLPQPLEFVWPRRHDNRDLARFRDMLLQACAD